MLFFDHALADSAEPIEGDLLCHSRKECVMRSSRSVITEIELAAFLLVSKPSSESATVNKAAKDAKNVSDWSAKASHGG